jgi:2-dehydropantoate 2-reductase
VRFAVFGAGGAGGYLGARLAEAGEDVVFIARGEHLAAIREKGFRLESIAGDVHVQPATATDHPEEVEPVDAVVAATKTWQLPSAAAAMRRMVGPDTAVVPVLNGVEAPAMLTEALGPEPVLGGLCGMQAFIGAPGLVRHVGADPWIAFGELDGRMSERVDRLREAFGRCRALKVDVPSDINVAMWEKFMFIASTGGLGSATRAPFGVFRSRPETRAVLEKAMREVLAVGRGRGIALPDDAVDRSMALVDRLEPHVTSSMQRDIMAGRRSELDHWSGAVDRLGREVAVETPVHSFLFSVLLPQELMARGEIELPET